MLSYFKGTLAATKLTNTIAETWKDLVNYLKFREPNIKLEQSFSILREIYFVVRFSYHATHLGDNEKKTGALIVLLHENLKKVFTKYFEEIIGDARVSKGVNTLIDSFESLYSSWQNQILQSHESEKFKGTGFMIWIEIVISNFLEQIQEIYENIGKGSEDDDIHMLSPNELLNIHSIITNHLKEVM